MLFLKLAGTLTANNVNLTSNAGSDIGANGNAILTAASTLTVASAGNAYLSNAGSITLGGGGIQLLLLVLVIH